jgi:Cd2+/Zn2+-exporting ATPase
MTRSKIVFKIHGMDCAEEVSLLKREVGPVVGGDENLSFDLLAGRMTVRVIDGPLASGVIEDAVSRAGLSADRWVDDETPSDDATRRLRQGRVIATAASGLAIAMALVSQAFLRGGQGTAIGVERGGIGHDVPTLSIVLYGIAIGCGLWYVAPRAWLAIRAERMIISMGPFDP